MRRLLVLLLALVPGWLALRLLTNADAITPWLLRDAALLAAFSIGLAAWGALGAVDAGVAAQFAWPNAGRALFGAGAVTALVGAALRLLGMPNAAIVWGIGIALMLAGAFWRGAAIRYAAPAFRWERDAGGRFVRRPMDGDTAGDLALMPRPAVLWGSAVVIVLLGGALRVALALAQPPVCMAFECDAVLALSGGSAGNGSLVAGAASRILLLWIGDALQALRLAGAFVSTMALAALAPALRRWTTGAGMLLGLVLAAAAAPFALPAYGPWLDLGVLVPLVFWGIGAGLAEGGARPWAVAGLALGLAAVLAPELAAAWMIWFLVLAVLLAVSRRWRDLGVLALAALAAAAASSARVAGLLLPLQGDWGKQAWASGALDFVAAWTATAAPWLGALVLVGVGVALRSRRRGAALLAGAAAVLFVLLRPGVAPLAEQEKILPLLPFAALLAALSGDQLLRAAARAWGPARAHAAPLLVPAFALILFLSLPPLWQAARTADVATASDDLALAAAAYAATMADTANEPVGRVLLLPPALLEHPAVRLAAAQGIETGRVRAYSPFADLPWRDAAAASGAGAPGGIVYLLESTDTALLDELKRVYPDGRSDLVAAEAGNAGLLTAYTVDGATLFDSEGLAQFVYAGSDWGSADEAAMSIGVGPLEFGWGAHPPAAPPFSVEWTGALRVTDAGSHTFAVEAPPGALFSLLLDGQLILDTSAGLTTHTESLPAGLYNMQMRYRDGGPVTGDLALRWQPPGQETLVPIPRSALHNPALPPIGLLGTYTVGGAWDGAVLERRNDRIVAADPSLPLPWGVVWQGQIAAPRAGEYRIGAVSNGTLFMDVAGERVASRLPASSSTDDAAAPPSEGSIYLEQGWHPVTIRFAATEAAVPEFKLYWQPPGQGPSALSAAFLLPFTGERTTAEAPLPSLGPPDTRFGSDTFALTVDASLIQPQVSLPPQGLPPLPFERLGSAASCGGAIDQLNAPHGLAFDPGRGLLYIADTGNRRVLAYVVDGAELRSPLVLPLEALEEPVDVAVTPQGILYVLDTAAPRLVRYDAATGESRAVGLGAGYYRPRGIAVDAFGTIYVADTGGARVTAIAEDGSLIAQFGGPSTELGRGQPVDVAPAVRALWAITAEDGRLWQVDTLGSLAAVRATNTIDGPHLATIAADTASGFVDAAAGAGGSGGLFLSDPEGARILYLGANGQPLGALAGTGAFERPTGLAAFRNGDNLLLAVADTATCTLTFWQARADTLPAPH